MRLSEFVISEVPLGQGMLGISPIPGRTRHYAEDLRRLLVWKPSAVVTMVTAAELARKGAGGLGLDMAGHGIGWHHLPVEDFGAPGLAVEEAWPDVSRQLHASLAQGGRVLAHCYGGCGRSGMILMRLMVEAGEAPEAALARLREVRPCAVETGAQEHWAATPARRS